MAGGIYSANLWKCAVVGLDSRFRGNDRRIEWIPIPNDTSIASSSGSRLNPHMASERADGWREEKSGEKKSLAIHRAEE
jgi:hypothetical protein